MIITSAKMRGVLYAVGVYLGLALHAALVGDAVLVTMHVFPDFAVWLYVAYAVYGVIATPLFGLAKANVPDLTPGDDPQQVAGTVLQAPND